MALSKARIYEDGKSEQAYYVQFNPASLSYSIHANPKSYKKICEKRNGGGTDTSAQSDPTQNTTMAYLSVTLFFHSYKNELLYTDVRSDVNLLQGFLRKSGSDPNSNKTIATSPSIVFAWGSTVHKGFLDNFSVTYQMFAADGTPVQAEVSITICGNDPDMVAERVDREQEEEYESNVASVRALGILPSSIAWLF